MPKWEQIADEWLNRGYHYEDLGGGSFRLWYDGVVRTILLDEPLYTPDIGPTPIDIK